MTIGEGFEKGEFTTDSETLQKVITFAKDNAYRVTLTPLSVTKDGRKFTAKGIFKVQATKIPVRDNTRTDPSME